MTEDLTICVRQLKSILDDYDDLSGTYKVLNFLGSRVNYGGRVTDDKDVRLISSILERFCCAGTLEVGFKFSQSDTYQSIDGSTQDDYMRYI